MKDITNDLKCMLFFCNNGSSITALEAGRFNILGRSGMLRPVGASTNWGGPMCNLCVALFKRGRLKLYGTYTSG